MMAPTLQSTASLRSCARGFASTARAFAEQASSASTPASTPRPRSNNRSPSQSGGRASDRVRAGQRNRTSQQSGQKGSDRRGKRLPSVLDESPAAAQVRANRAINNKGLLHGSQKVPAPLPKTDWNNPLFSKPGFERLLAPAPRPSSVFTPDLAAAAPSTPAAAGKGKGKATAAPAKVANAKLNLPGIKTAVNALKLHVRPGARNILGPVNNPTGVAVGFLSQNRAALPRSNSVKGSDNKSLAEELKAARIALQNEQIGGSYERFEPQSVLKAAGVKNGEKGDSVTTKAIHDAAQALAINADVAPEGKVFVAKTIAERLSA